MASGSRGLRAHLECVRAPRQALIILAGVVTSTVVVKLLRRHDDVFEFPCHALGHLLLHCQVLG